MISVSTARCLSKILIETVKKKIGELLTPIHVMVILLDKSCNTVAMPKVSLMRNQTAFAFTCTLLLSLLAYSAQAGVMVGSSSLIQTLDYSDTFTLTANDGNAGRTSGTYPVGSPGTDVEDDYGNPA